MSKSILQALGKIDVALGEQSDDAVNVIDALNQISDRVGALKTSVDDINSMEIKILSDGEYNSETGVPTVENPVKGTFYLTPAKNEEDNNMFNKYYINDDGEWEMFGSASIDVNSLFNLSDRMAKGVDDNGDVVDGAVIEGNLSNKASGGYSHAEGWNTAASKSYSHAEGIDTKASSFASHAEGYSTTASNQAAHTEGQITTASGSQSHAEGFSTVASGDSSHAEGFSTVASGDGSHAEGYYTTASGDSSHAEGGYYSYDKDNVLYLRGQANSLVYTYTDDRNFLNKQSIIPGHQYFFNYHLVTVVNLDTVNKTITLDKTLDKNNSYITDVYIFQPLIASGISSHAEGISTIANHKSQHVFGEYNIIDSSFTNASDRGNYIEIVGNGTSLIRSNARTLDWDGNESLAGSLTLGKDTADEVTITAAQLKSLLALLNT